MSGEQISLEIGELVLHGVDRNDGHAIAAAIAVEVERLFGNERLPGLIENGTSLAELDAGSIRTGGLESPTALGERIGRALFQGMGAEPR